MEAGSSSAAAATGLLHCGHRAYASSVSSSITSVRCTEFLGRRLWPLAPERAKHLSRPCSLPVIRSMDATFGGGPAAIFPRVNVRDPYKRLGVSRDASEEEIREAHSFLYDQYAGHERSRESIGAAYDRIIMDSFRARKKSKINLKSNLKKKVEEAPPWVHNLLSFVEVPTTQVILQRAVFFALMGVWSVMNSAEGGPAFQVAVSLAGCVYLLNYRLKSIGRSFILGFGGLVVGWVLGSFLVPTIPPVLFPQTWSLELITALISYVFMWLSCTFLK